MPAFPLLPLSLVAAFVACLAVPAAARCPVAGDLGHGVQVTYADGALEVGRQCDLLSVVTVDLRDAEGTTNRLEYARGLYLLSESNKLAISDTSATPDMSRIAESRLTVEALS